MLDVSCFHGLSQVTRFEAELDALNLASRRKDPFSTLAFIRNLAAHPAWYPGDLGVEPWFLIAWEDNQVVGYLALRRAGQRLEFFVTHDHDCPQLVALPAREAEVSAAFYRYLLGRGSEWNVLEFQHQVPGSPLTPPPHGLPLKGYFARTFPADENHTIPVRWRSLEDYVKALGSNWRRHVRKKTQKLLAAGALTWVSSDDPAATPVLLALLRRTEARSWKSGHATALGSHPDRLAWFRGLLGPDQPLKLKLSVLLLDGIPIGGSICGEYGPTCFGLVTVFDDRAEQLSPGVILQLMMVRSAIDGGCTALNLLRGFGYYKTHWLAQPTPTSSGQLYRIGKQPFWRAIVGDFRRRVLAQGPTAGADHNPDKRSAPERKGAAPLVGSPLERAEVGALLAQLNGLKVERLGPRELADLLPFGEKTRPGA